MGLIRASRRIDAISMMMKGIASCFVLFGTSPFPVTSVSRRQIHRRHTPPFVCRAPAKYYDTDFPDGIINSDVLVIGESGDCLLDTITVRGVIRVDRGVGIQLEETTVQSIVMKQGSAGILSEDGVVVKDGITGRALKYFELNNSTVGGNIDISMDDSCVIIHDCTIRGHLKLQDSTGISDGEDYINIKSSDIMGGIYFRRTTYMNFIEIAEADLGGADLSLENVACPDVGILDNTQVYNLAVIKELDVVGRQEIESLEIIENEVEGTLEVRGLHGLALVVYDNIVARGMLVHNNSYSLLSIDNNEASSLLPATSWII